MFLHLVTAHTAMSCCYLDTLQEIVAQVLSSRQSLPNTYQLQIRREHLHNDGARLVKHHDIINVWCNGMKRRTDCTVIDSTEATNEQRVRSVTCRNCLKTGHATTTVTGRGGNRHLVESVKITDSFDRSDIFYIDWRQLGCLFGHFRRYSLGPPDSFLRNLANDPLGRQEATTLHGQPCVLLKRTLAAGTQNAYFSPSHGMNLIRVEQTSHDKKYLAVLSVKLSSTADGRYWFPSSVHYVTSDSGSTILEETLTVETAEWTAPAAAVFTLEGLSLEEGQAVQIDGIKKNAYYPTWRNGKLDYNQTVGKVTEERLRLAAPEPSPVRDEATDLRRVRLLYAAGFAAAVGLVAWRAARRLGRQ
jgi:hypothetical protein